MISPYSSNVFDILRSLAPYNSDIYIRKLRQAITESLRGCQPDPGTILNDVSLKNMEWQMRKKLEHDIDRVRDAGLISSYSIQIIREGQNVEVNVHLVPRNSFKTITIETRISGA